MKKYLLFLSLILSFNLLAETEEEQFGDMGNITDQERVDSETFVHQGQVQNAYNAECKDNPQLCTDGTLGFKKKGWQTVEQMVPIVAKAYGMFFGMTGSKIKMKPTD